MPFFQIIKNILIDAAPAMPPDLWWVTACILSLLAFTAIIDFFTSLVPDIFIFLGLFLLTLTLGISASWDVAALHVRHAIYAGLLIWAINFIWYKKFHHDALGMGDAKWTMLAVACFGFMPALFAWGLGAVLAVCFMGAMHLAKHKITRVTFSPFLFIGLMAGIYWIEFRY